MNSEYLEMADRIGARLCRDALWSAGRCNWTGEFLEGETLEHGSLGPGIYSGTSGIALFLWRLAEATGDSIIRSTALGAIGQALSKLPYPGCGLYNGGLGILYAAAQIRGEFDENAAYEQARPHAAALDLISGSAGAIAILLDFERRRGCGRWLEAAMAHGDLLLAEAIRAEDGWSWKTMPHPRNVTGLSHGTAGIGWALAELWNASGEARFRQGAMEAFRYERSCFDAARGNWPDFRQDPPVYPAVWCHGAGGIGFSRVRAWQISGDGEYLAEARVACGTVADGLGSAGSFCLCHGTAGNADLLIYASQVLGEEKWLDAARKIGEEAIARYERRSLPWPCGLKGNEVPGLMMGMAGIGYFYLRLADPGVPTVLLPGAPTGSRS